MDSAISFSNLSKYFGSGEKLVKAVDGISFDVPQGELFGFLGPNGAGKTTVIRCLMDFIRPTSGTIEILGKDAQKHSVELNKDLGYLSGYVELYHKWTGTDHINFFSRLNGGAPAAESLMKRLNFDPSVRTKKLSSGNRQKLGLILALMHNPTLLIMDEPTNALDPLLQQVVYELLREAQDRGATVFMSSHNLTEVERVCSEVAIIRQGKIVARESIEALRRKRLYTIKGRTTESLQLTSDMVAGAEIESQAENSFALRVKSDIAPVLAALGQLPLQDIEVQHASLEDVFLEHYQS